MNEELQKKYFIKNKIDHSFKISSKLSSEKIRRNFTIMSPGGNKKFLHNKTTNNSRKKDIFQEINISKANHPFIFKRMDNILPNDYMDNIIIKNKHQYLNNNLNNVIYVQSQTSPNQSPKLIKKIKASKIDQNKKIIDRNNNHSYHEICTISGRKANATSKTIYHDYSNLDKRLILNNSTKNMNNIQTKFKINGNYFYRNFSVNNMQKPIQCHSKKLTINNNSIENSITRDENNKIKIKFINKKKYENNYKIFDDMNNDVNYKYISRNINNGDNYYKRNKPIEYDENLPIKYVNTAYSRNNKIYNSFNKYINDDQNINYVYDINSTNDLIHKINPLIKNSFSNHNYTFNNENKQNILKQI